MPPQDPSLPVEEHPELEPETLAALLLRMFEFSPVAMLISTTGPEAHRYLKANKAFLELSGFSWEEIAGQDMTAAGPAIDSPARNRRLRLLDEQGGYRLEEVEIKHASGRIVHTLVSSQRSMINGLTYDFDVLLDVSDLVALQKEREQQLASAARTDGLTGLPNRMAFDLKLAERLAAAGTDTRVALAFIDLNRFKPINDRYGHGIGDEVLRELAARLLQNCEQDEVAARIGGDEFAIILNLPAGETSSLAARLGGIAAAVFRPIAIAEGTLLQVGAAIGVGIQTRAHDREADLLQLADRQMYIAKATGEPVCIRMATTDEAG